MASTTRWIRTADELSALVRELRGCRAIAIDTEADSLHHYTEKVCLIQLAAHGGSSYLIDPLALSDLSPLAPILADASVLKVVHGGDNDITSMRRDFGVSFRTMFDTGIAANLLGDTELGLQAMVRNELGIELNKGSQRDDWSKRPLTEKQEAYALADVAYLFDLATRLTERLHAAGRTEWAREEFAALANLPPAVKRSGPDEFRRIKGSNKLSRRKQAVLREIYEWREARAAAADRPPFMIVRPDVLFALADIDAPTLDDVEDALSSSPRQSREVENVFAAIQRGLDLPDSELPARERSTTTARMSSAAQDRVEALRAWRDDEAQHARLNPSTVMSQKLIERIAIANPKSLDELAAVEGIRQWRVTEWGDAVLEHCS